MRYKFRLTFFHPSSGFFQSEKSTIPFFIEKGRKFILTARDADTLIKATKFHIDGIGFLDAESAYEYGEKLRIKLRVLNAMLSMGFTIPLVDGTSGKVSDDIKKDIFEKTGAVYLDTIVGLEVFPDDKKHFEHVLSAKINVAPSDPLYLINAIKSIWPIDMDLDARSEDALNILNISIAETSPSAQFLTTFLALERLIVRLQRNEIALSLLKEFQNAVSDSQLSKIEKESLKGALGNLHEESFSNALIKFSYRIKEPTNIAGKTPRAFFSECIRVRNLIAHDSTLDPSFDLRTLTQNLRNVVISLIWTNQKLPSVSVYQPHSNISFESMEIRIL
jgi:hypothetical protein